MFYESIHRLTEEQKHDLEGAGIGRRLVSEWRRHTRLPTEPQAVIYADIVGVDRHELADELALLRATDTQRPLLERIMGKAVAGGLAMLAFGVGAGAPHAPANGDRAATMYIMSTQ